MRYAYLLVVCAAACAQEAMPPRQILEKMRAAYTGLRRGDVEGSVEISDMRVPFRMAFERPDKLRMEGSLGSGPESSMVTDGKTTWRYDPEKHAYTRKAGPPELDLDMNEDELKRLGIDPSSPDVAKFSEVMLAGFRKAADSAARAKLLRTETLRPAGVECYVVEIPDPKMTLWIDTTKFRILRMESAGERFNFTTVSLNEPLPDGVFTFVPPAGARLVDELN